MSVSLRRPLVVALALGTVALAASAAVAQETLTLRVTVAESCSMESSTILFDTYYSGQERDLTATGSIEYTGCPEGTTVILGTGEGAYEQRILLNGSNVLEYSLYKEEGFSDEWMPDGLTLADGADGSGTIPVYARIPGGQSVATGDYVDNVQITWSF